MEREAAIPRAPVGLIRVPYTFKTSPFTWLIVIAALLLAVFVPLLAPMDAIRVDPGRRFLPPTWGLWLGTDHLGRDLFVMISGGLRTSLSLALSVVAVSAILGWIIGSLTGYIGGLFDTALTRIIDVFDAFPGIILSIALVTVLGASYASVFFVLVIVSWMTYARVVRARVLTLRSNEYVVASRMFGSTTAGTIWGHIRPNTVDLVISVAVVQIPQAMLTESTISFLGFGLRPPDISLGYLIASERDYLQTNPLPVIAAGLVLVIVCASIATIGLNFRRPQ